MCCSRNNSSLHAKSLLILGHTTSGMGEKSLAIKFKTAVEKAGFSVVDLLDILTVMGDQYEPLARINYDLADLGHPIMDDLIKGYDLPGSDALLILSWSFSLAALFATGIHKTRPTIAKLFAHHPEERILPELYTPASLLITESLLAHERAIAYGLEPSKLLYIPHCYPVECEIVKPERHYVTQLAERQKKNIRKRTRVIGCVSRFDYGKNCEFAVEAVRRLYQAGQDIVLVLKGNFPEVTNFPDYKPLFSKMLEAYKKEPWLLWDESFTPFPNIMEEYASFDLLLHPSGAEGASHVVTEFLGLGKPVVLLNCSSNPYLFKHLANFVKTTGTLREGPLPFYFPDLDDLCRVLESRLVIPDPDLVKKRFHEERLRSRIPYIFNPDPHLIKEFYEDDRITFGI